MIPIKNIYYMLAYAIKGLNVQGYKRLAAESFENSAELGALILAYCISKQIKRGMRRDYIQRSEALSVLRGQLDIPESIKTQAILKRKMVCTYDEFSTNFRANSIIKSTLELLLRSDIDKERKKELRKLMVFFADVKTIDLRAVDWKMHYDKNNQTYQMLVSICYLAFKGLLQSQSGGSTKLMDFGEKLMHRLYEKFILEYYRRHHKEYDPKSPQIEWNLAEEAGNQAAMSFLPTMQTDVCLSRGDKALIIDAKYYSKILLKQQYDNSKEKLRSHHLYQIFAYVKNKDKDHTGNVAGLLLYAKTNEDITPDYMFDMDGNKIGAKTLDLNQDFKDIAIQLDSIIAEYFYEQEQLGANDL